MKITYRIPTEQYAYVEIEDDVDEGFFDPEKMLEQYQTFKETFAVNDGVGMDEKEMDVWVYNMLLQKGNDADVYQKATQVQQKELHRIKRALARIKRNHMEPEVVNGEGFSGDGQS